MSTPDFQNLIDLAVEIHELNVSKGFYDDVKTGDALDMVPKVALIASEVFEMLEELRYREPRADKHLLHRSAEEVECADVFIRLLDYIVARGFIDRFATIAREKHEYNKNRPYKNGKKF